MDPIVGQLIRQLVLILCNAVFACAEIAVTHSRTSSKNVILFFIQGSSMHQ